MTRVVRRDVDGMLERRIDANIDNCAILSVHERVPYMIRTPCFGSNGVLGMKASSSAVNSRPAERWVALALALAAVRLCVLC